MHWPRLHRRDNAHNHSGQSAEQLARHYLQQQGLKFIAANTRGPGGEIDLIMSHAEVLVFIEVRLRRNRDFTSACESVDARKQRKIIKTAMHYLQKKGLTDSVVCRFDVVALSTLDPRQTPQWITNAFTAT